MNSVYHRVSSKSQQEFLLRFQRRLIEYLSEGGAVAEGFGIVWERTLDEVPLHDDAQGEIYRTLLAWAKSDEIFSRRKEPVAVMKSEWVLLAMSEIAEAQQVLAMLLLSRQGSNQAGIHCTIRELQEKIKALGTLQADLVKARGSNVSVLRPGR